MFVRVPNGLKLALVCAFAFTARSAFAQPPQLVTTIDLGVLPGQIFAQAQAVSPNGTVAGMTYGSDYIRHIFLWKQASGMIDLGGGYPDVQVTGVNDQGLVVGSVLASDYQRYVFRATAGSSPTLDPMPCVDYCDRVGLNASGQVVGSHYGVNGAQHAFVWSLTTNPIDLPFTPGAIGARATAINDAGQITGSFLLTTSPDPNVLTAALWTPNGSVYTAEDLGRFSDQSGGTAINAAGTIIGSYGDSSGNFVKGFKWTRSGGMVDLSASTANVWILWASGIAPGGLIAGGVSDANYSQYAFIYKDGVGLRRLSNPAGIAGASAAAIDSFGLTSGAGSAASGSHAVAWQSCQSLDVHPAGFGHSRIQAANDSSFAVGWVASDDYSVFHAFAWQFAHPGPPPPTPCDLDDATAADTTAPVITGTPSNITAEATSASGATVTYTVPTAVDAVDGAVAVSCTPAPGASFNFGTTTVSCTAADSHANMSSTTFTVKVQDTTPPVIASIAPSTGTLWPPNGKMVPVSIAIAASDLGGPVTCSVTGVTSSQRAIGYWVKTGPLAVQLRAERTGGDQAGRIYTIAVTCTDPSGYASSATTRVTVPHDQGK